MIETLIVWFSDNSQVRIALAIIFLTLFTFIYLKITRRSGIILLIGITIVISFSFMYSPIAQLFAWVLLIPMLIHFRLTKAKKPYEAAVATLEVNTICRGLSEAEASILLEEPAEIVFAVAILSLINRDVLEWDEKFPERLSLGQKITDCEDMNSAIRTSLLEHGVLIETYEEPIVEELLIHGKRELSEIYIGVFIKLLHRSVLRKIQPFDLAASRAYYIQKVERVKSQYFNKEPKENRKQLRGDRSLWLVNNNSDLQTSRDKLLLLASGIRKNIANNRYQVEDIGGKKISIAVDKPIQLNKNGE